MTKSQQNRTAVSRVVVETVEARKLFSSVLTTRGLTPATIDSGETTTQTDVGPGYTGEKTGSIGLAQVTLIDGVLTVYGSESGERFHPVISRGKLSFETTRYFASGAIDGYGEITTTPLARPVTFLNLSTDDLTPITPVVGPDSVYRVSLADVKKIVLYAKGGADDIDLSNLDIPAEVHGGTGDDTIVGTNANDTLFGENGSDAITDGRGNDLLAGGRGNDLLVSRRGLDTLLGQAGDDRVYSYSADAALSGGDGNDIGLLQAAPDGVTGVEVTSRGSRFEVMPIYSRVYGTTVKLRKSGDSLAMDVGVVLSDSGWAVDWDIVRNDSNAVSVNVATYRSTGGFTMALKQYVKTFELGQTRDRRRMTISVTNNGSDLLRKSVAVDSAFVSKTLRAGEYAYDIVEM